MTPAHGSEALPRLVDHVCSNYRSHAVARLPGGSTIPLGDAPAGTPRLAMRKLRQRAAEIADQLDPPWARPVRHWLDDTAEHERALAELAAGNTYAFTATDETGVCYVLTAEVASRLLRR